MCNATHRGWAAESGRDQLLPIDVRVLCVLRAEWVNILNSFSPVWCTSCALIEINVLQPVNILL